MTKEKNAASSGSSGMLDRIIAEIVRQKKGVDSAALEETRQKRNGKPLSSWVVQKGWMTEEDLLTELAVRIGVPYWKDLEALCIAHKQLRSLVLLLLSSNIEKGDCQEDTAAVMVGTYIHRQALRVAAILARPADIRTKVTMMPGQPISHARGVTF